MIIIGKYKKNRTKRNPKTMKINEGHLYILAMSVAAFNNVPAVSPS